MNRKIKMRGIITVIWIVVVLGMTAAFFYSCTSPDAVYAKMKNEADQTESLYDYGNIVSREEDMNKPEEILERDGVTYRLVSFEKQEVPVDGVLTYMSASVPYELEGQQQPPEKTIVTLFDEKTGEEYERELSFLEAQEKQSVWEDTFSFPITVSGCDADVFYLGDVEIPGTANLLEFRSEFLRILELSEQDYRIHSIEWVDEPYEQDGIFYRNALATGEKRIRFVDAKYGGEIRTPETKGYRYVSVYERLPEFVEESIPEDESVLEVPDSLLQTTQETEMTLMERILSFVKEHLTIVTMSFLFIAAIIGVIVMLVVSRKRKEQE